MSLYIGYIYMYDETCEFGNYISYIYLYKNKIQTQIFLPLTIIIHYV